jgi:SAM-dependent methyltransferase
MDRQMKSPIVKVPSLRWKQAQEWELKIWQKQNSWSWHRLLVHRTLNALHIRKSHSGDDWNEWWCTKFNFYRNIPQKLDNAIELGCGPYTNMRLIQRGRSISHIFCSDPLASEYIKFSGRWLAREYTKGTILLDNHPLEECPFAHGYFDLVVLINVLDHVQDAMLCLQNAIALVKKNGYFVFGQDLSDESDAINEDIGHPIRLRHEDLRDCLKLQMSPLLEHVLDRTEGRNPKAHYGTYLYIGKLG